MTPHKRAQALRLHQRLPEHLWELLVDLGISPALIHERLLGWDGTHITVPFLGRDRRVLGYEYVGVGSDGSLDVDLSRSLRRPLLYGEHRLSAGLREVVLVQGVLEALLLESTIGLMALAPSGDGLSFLDEWATCLTGISKLSLCFRRSDEGVKAALYLQSLMPHAKVVLLPEWVGAGGGVADFFSKGGTAESFRALLTGHA